MTYLYENVTERIALESRYNALIEVQRETLDTLREGVAVFDPNGRLRLHNRAFATMWRLNPRRLDGEPHIEEIIVAMPRALRRARGMGANQGGGDGHRRRTTPL